MKRLTLLLAGAGALAGCSMEPRDVRPAAPVPPAWPTGDAYPAPDDAALPSVGYRDIFTDSRLQALIEQALVNNRDLRVAAANIRIAREQYVVQRAGRLPTINLGGGVTESRGSSGGSSSGGTGTGGTGGTGGTTGGGSGGASERTTLSTQLGLTSFEIDLFGRVASLTRAAQDQYFASQAGARATRLTLIGELANAWLTYAADASLLAIAEDTARNAEASVRLTRVRLEGGIAPRTDLRQAEQVLEQARASIAAQRTALAQDVNALQLLVGAPVEARLLPGSIDEAAATVKPLPAGVDSGVLLRRPDVVQAEYQLRAANAQIGAARAALFPRISLTGLLGFTSDALRTLFDDGRFTWQAGANASYPIFNGGAGRANVRLSEAQREAALARYEGTIQTAFREVADALARRGTIAEQRRAVAAQAEAAADTYQLAEARYRGGIDSFLSSLDAQRSLFTARRTLVATQLTEASNLVALYRTLGGDSRLDPTDRGPVPVGGAALPGDPAAR